MAEATFVPGRRLTLSILLLASLTIMANATISPSLPGLKEHFSGVSGIDTPTGVIVALGQPLMPPTVQA
jgi:hypothetical protein